MVPRVSQTTTSLGQSVNLLKILPRWPIMQLAMSWSAVLPIGCTYGLDIFALLRPRKQYQQPLTTIATPLRPANPTVSHLSLPQHGRRIPPTWMNCSVIEAMVPISRAMPAVSEESALTESGNPDSGLRGWTFSNYHGKCPIPTRPLLVPESLHVRILGKLGLRILMAGVFFLPAHHVQRHLLAILRALMRVQKKACITAHPNYICLLFFFMQERVFGGTLP